MMCNKIIKIEKNLYDSLLRFQENDEYDMRCYLGLIPLNEIHSSYDCFLPLIEHVLNHYPIHLFMNKLNQYLFGKLYRIAHEYPW